MLTDVTALYGLTNVTGDVVIRWNFELGGAADALVDEIDFIGGSTFVHDN